MVSSSKRWGRAWLGVALIAASAVLFMVTAVPYGLRTPTDYCVQFGEPPAGEIFAENPAPHGSYSLLPLGVTCTFVNVTGERFVIQDDWSASVTGYTSVALAVCGVALLAASLRRGRAQR